MSIIYDFTFEDGGTFHCEVPLQGWGESATTPTEALPAWTLLATDTCPKCPLDRSTHRYCPAAVDLHVVAAKFAAIASYQRARVSVLVGERTYVSECDINTGLRSLFGLYMALSGCPIASRLRPLAVRHVPFASMQETLSRVVSHYLLKQYLVMRSGGTPDWELKGLVALYDTLDTVNSAFARRINHASERDSNLNAVNGFGTFSRLYAMALDELLAEERDLYLPGF